MINIKKMNTVKSNIKIIPYSFLIALLWLTLGIGCADETEISIKKEVPVSEINVTLNIPDSRTPSVSTRSMVGEGDKNKEDEVTSIDLLVFDTTNPGEEFFVEWVKGEILDMVFAESNSENAVSTVNFTAKLKRRRTKSQIIIIANHSLTEDFVNGFTPEVTPRKEVLEALTYSTSGQWKTDGSSTGGYTPIPMCGEINLGDLKQQVTPITNVDLVRMLARIDIENNADNFILEEVHLANYNTTGYIVPLSDVLPSLPTNPGKKKGETINYSVNLANEGKYYGEIYAYESAAAVDPDKDPANPNKDLDNEDIRKYATCLILKGKIGETESPSYYYRVDFTSGEASEAQYMPLKRNYKYVVSINGVSEEGVGYGNISDAIDSYTVLSNLKTRVISYNRDLIKNIVFNGQYILGVDKSEVHTNQEWTSGEIKVFTNNPTGWKATSNEGWLTFNGSTNEGNVNENSIIEYVADNYYGEDKREAIITITAGRLTTEIKVTQVKTKLGTLTIIDETGKDIVVTKENGDLEATLYFLQENPEPRTVYLVWSGEGTCKAKVTVNNMNNLSLGSMSTIVGEEQLFTGGIQAITISPGSTTESWAAAQIACYLEAIGQQQYITLNAFQDNMVFNLSNSRTNGYPWGNQYDLIFQTNMEWEIENVEIVGDAGLISEAERGGIKVGNKGVGNDFKLSFTAGGSWFEETSGSLNVTFKLVKGNITMQKTIAIDLTSQPSDYTSGGKPRVYFYPAAYVNTEIASVPTELKFTWQEAEAKCKRLGGNWTIPTMSDLFLGYVYKDALGGFPEVDGWFGWSSFWSSTIVDDKYVVLDMDKGLNYGPPDIAPRNLRCVYKNDNEPQYPYIDHTSMGEEGVIIVSREGQNGVDLKSLGQEGDNTVAPKLLVSNDDTETWSDANWADAKDFCAKRTPLDTWRLPTQRELYLIWGLGGVADPTEGITGPGYDHSDWGNNYSPLKSDPSYVSYWTKTKGRDGNSMWFLKTQDAALQDGADPLNPDGWRFNIRCVRSLD